MSVQLSCEADSIRAGPHLLCRPALSNAAVTPITSAGVVIQVGCPACPLLPFSPSPPCSTWISFNFLQLTSNPSIHSHGANVRSQLLMGTLLAGLTTYPKPQRSASRFSANSGLFSIISALVTTNAWPEVGVLKWEQVQNEAHTTGLSRGLGTQSSVPASAWLGLARRAEVAENCPGKAPQRCRHSC